MMTKTLLLIAAVFLSLFVKSQVVVSACTAHDSVVKLYKKDADRLAVRRVFHINSTWKDSVPVNRTISNQYLGALIAVYNATALPVRDTICALLKLHTKPDPEINALTVKASGSLSWMQHLQSSTLPTGNAAIDHLMNKYYLQDLSYYQSTPYDVAVFKTDTNCNVAALNARFAGISGVIGSDPSGTFNDVKNITDSINASFVMLAYSYGYGSCSDGCDFRTYWTFKVYNDCKVEYLGRTGDTPLFAGIAANAATFNDVTLFPNPATDKLNIALNSQAFKNTELQVINMLGEPVLVAPLDAYASYTVDISGFAAGIYYATLKNESGVKVFKVIKE